MRVSFLRPWAFALVSALCVPCATRAAAINYGNSPVIPPGVTFLGVTESSSTDPVPLFGPPSYFTTGIDFNPTSFGASSSGGGGDVTDGQLNFTVAGTVSPSQVVAISQVSLAESGDYTLVGTGTVATQTIAGGSIKVTVKEIDGVTLGTPIVLTPSNASVGFNLIANPGVLQPWALGTSLNITAQLTALAIPFTYGATRVDVVMDDNVIALSEASTAAFIAKKDFTVGLVGNVSLVPEPAGLMLLTVGAVGALARRRGR